VSLTNAIHSAYNEVPSLAYVDEVFEGQAWSWQANVEESTLVNRDDSSLKVNCVNCLPYHQGHSENAPVDPLDDDSRSDNSSFIPSMEAEDEISDQQETSLFSAPHRSPSLALQVWKRTSSSITHFMIYSKILT